MLDEGDCEAEMDGDREELTLALREDETDEEMLADGLCEAEIDALTDGETDGETDAETDALGL